MSRANPAQENRWNAWRWPTELEISRGRREDDPFFVGSDFDKSEAVSLLPRNEDGQHEGQIQFGRDGQVLNYP